MKRLFEHNLFFDVAGAGQAGSGEAPATSLEDGASGTQTQPNPPAGTPAPPEEAPEYTDTRPNDGSLLANEDDVPVLSDLPEASSEDPSLRRSLLERLRGLSEKFSQGNPQNPETLSQGEALATLVEQVVAEEVPADEFSNQQEEKQTEREKRAERRAEQRAEKETFFRDHVRKEVKDGRAQAEKQAKIFQEKGQKKLYREVSRLVDRFRAVEKKMAETDSKRLRKEQATLYSRFNQLVKKASAKSDFQKQLALSKEEKFKQMEDAAEIGADEPVDGEFPSDKKDVRHAKATFREKKAGLKQELHKDLKKADDRRHADQKEIRKEAKELRQDEEVAEDTALQRPTRQVMEAVIANLSQAGRLSDEQAKKLLEQLREDSLTGAAFFVSENDEQEERVLHAFWENRSRVTERDAETGGLVFVEHSEETEGDFQILRRNSLGALRFIETRTAQGELEGVNLSSMHTYSGNVEEGIRAQRRLETPHEARGWAMASVVDSWQNWRLDPDKVSVRTAGQGMV